MHPEECLICKAPLEYLVRDEDMECAICHKKESSKTRCVNGHYVCNDCHTQGMDTIFGLCLAETSADPAAILRRMMDLSFCHMHGPEHHVMVGAALLTAYKNAGGKLDLESALREMYSRGRAVPGGACGFWGARGAGISAGRSWPPWTSSGSAWGWSWPGACPSAPAAPGTASASAGAAPSRRSGEGAGARPVDSARPVHYTEGMRRGDRA